MEGTGVQPVSLPFDIPYSFALDASGSGKYMQQFANDYYYSATISGTTGGTPSWSLLRQGVFLQPAVGANVAMSAGVMAPGTQLTIQVTGGIPNATVSGLIYGAKSSTQTELSVPIALPSSPGIVQIPQRFQLKTAATDPSFIYTVPYDGLVHTYTFQLPPGTLTARWWFLQPPGTPAAHWSKMNIIGNNTGSSYNSYSEIFDGSGGSTTIPIASDDTFRLWPADTSLIVTAQLDANGTTAAPFIFMLEASLMQDTVRAIISGEGTLSGNNIGLFDGSAMVVRLSNNTSAPPPPWISFPFSASIDANETVGSDFQIIAAPNASQNIYVGPVSFGSNAAAKLALKDPGATPVEFARMLYLSATQAPHVIPFGGKKITAGQPLNGNLLSGGTEVELTVNYNVG